jgi:hypothetical protein
MRHRILTITCGTAIPTNVLCGFLKLPSCSTNVLPCRATPRIRPGGQTMNGKRTLDVLLCTLCAGACCGLLGLDLAVAGVEDSRFEFSPDGASVEFDVRDTSRREVLSQLFAGSDLEITWINAAFAAERIRGKFTGTPAAVARQLLAQTNFVIVYDGGETSRAVRLLVVGPAQGEQSSAGLAALTAAIKPVSKPKDPPESESVGGAPMRPEPARALKPQLTDAAPMIAEGRKPAPMGATPVRAESRSSPLAAAARTQSDPVVAASETGRGADAAGLLKPPAEDAAAPLPILKGRSDAPPLVLPSQTLTAMPLTAMPLTPAPAGTPAQALRAVPTEAAN